jgi:plasmid stabilization system protein ParE
MPAVRVLEAAAAEAAEAAAWYEARRKGLGAEFRSEIRLALDRLREGILRGTPWPGRLGQRGVKRLLMQRFPFSVVFVAVQEEVTVLALAHHRRKPGYWRHRRGPAKGR